MTDPAEVRRAEEAAAEPQRVRNPPELLQAAARWRECAILGVDTEFVRERTYRAHLGLIQVSDGATAWLVDPVAITDLDPVRDMLTDRRIVKVFHSASEDLEVLWNTLGVSPDPMFDTQIASALVGQPLQISYHNAVKWLCGVSVDKEQTRSNWLKRPLTPAQLHYAACDVTFLPMVYRQVRGLLEEAGRLEWAAEDVERMRRQGMEAVSPETAYLRIRGAGRLDTGQLRTLQALCQWREETAAERDVARGFIVPDAALLSIAAAQPSTPEALRQVAEMHPRALTRFERDILRCVAASHHSAQPVEEFRPLDNRQKKLLDDLRDLVRMRSEELNVEPGLLASRRLLEVLLRTQATGAELPERLTGWRRAIITDRLLDRLKAY